MNKIKYILMCALVLSLTLGGVPANAVKRSGDKPHGKRLVIAEANTICDYFGLPDLIIDACYLQYATDGEQITGDGCVVNDIGFDNGVVDYKLQNCDRNENALLRKASSAILSLYDYLENNKNNKKATAASYLCVYADKYYLLQGVYKLESSEDLGAVAENIVYDLGLACD